MISQNIFISGFHFSHFPGNERCKTENQNGNRKTEKVKHFIFPFLEKQGKKEKKWKNGKRKTFSAFHFCFSFSIFCYPVSCSRKREVFPFLFCIFRFCENGKIGKSKKQKGKIEMQKRLFYVFSFFPFS